MHFDVDYTPLDIRRLEVMAGVERGSLDVAALEVAADFSHGCICTKTALFNHCIHKHTGGDAKCESCGRWLPYEKLNSDDDGVHWCMDGKDCSRAIRRKEMRRIQLGHSAKCAEHYQVYRKCPGCEIERLQAELAEAKRNSVLLADVEPMVEMAYREGHKEIPKSSWEDEAWEQSKAKAALRAMRGRE